MRNSLLFATATATRKTATFLFPAIIAMDVFWCCQTNEPKLQYLVDGYFYENTKERHSVRAASLLSLNALRFESDLCELNRL